MPQQTSDGRTVYRFSQASYDNFVKKFNKIVKRATKIGCEVPTYTILREYKNIIKDQYGRDQIHMGLEVEVAGSAPKIEGFTFVGAIEHLAEGNIVKGIGLVPLNQYMNAPSACDHCKIRRKRNQTFILADDDGEMKQIGSTCVRDFLGHHKSPENIATVAELFADFYDMCGSMEEDFIRGSGNAEWVNPLPHYLGIVRKIILRDGWVPRSRADEFNPATSDIAFSAMVAKEDKYRVYPDPFDIECAERAIAWAAELEDDKCANNEYLHNIRLIARRGLAEYRFRGYAASILPAYEREMSKKAEFKTSNAKSEYVGQIDEKIQLTVTLVSVHYIPSSYGEVTMSVYKDISGNIYKHFGKAFGELQFPVGETKVIWATIKKHSEYKGIKETHLTRCTLTEPGWSKKIKKN